MPDLLTPQALATAGPLLLETLFKHFIGPRPAADKGKAREDLMYDEAFVLMKTFIEIATKYPVSALQRFGQVRVPSPPWVGVHRVIIPRSSSNLAAEYLVKGLGGEEMAYKIAGGTKWWQVQSGQGVEAEWIVMKKDWKEVVAEEKREKLKRAEDAVGEEIDSEDEDGEFRPEMDRLRCMLYIHGGAYYWGSINTHRYTIWRYARKMHGRCFAVNYRKCPQYPFPCAIQDCLAAYLYLTNPPPGAKHRPVDPKSIIIAGDSAGGGLTIALLQLLRDTGFEMPAGAVLISPWSDLTHSFPSILQNTATDIIPPYGFIHKPSSLWPPPPPMLTEEVQSRLRTKVKEVVSRVHLQSHTPHPTLEDDENRDSPTTTTTTSDPDKSGNITTSTPSGGLEKSKERSESDLHPLADKSENKHPEPQTEPTHNPSRANPADLFQTLQNRNQNRNDNKPTTLAQCDIPLKLTVKGEQVLVDTQIQLYATNAQLCHPWISPVLGYLGGLPPLFIMCGDKEVLRDEIIFLAHKAANPDKFPIREDVKAMLPSLEGIEKKYGPTNVHLQVYDGTCHDLPLLSMTRPARGAFRAIANFARYVTPSAPGSRYISRSYPSTPKDSRRGSAAVSGSGPASKLTSGHHTPRFPSSPMLTATTPISEDHKVLQGILTSPPEAITPHESSRSSMNETEVEHDRQPELDLALGDAINVVDSPTTIKSKRDPLDINPLSPTTRPNTLGPSRNISFTSTIQSSVGNSSDGTSPKRKEGILPPSPDPANGSGSGIGSGLGMASGSGSGVGTGTAKEASGTNRSNGDEAGPRFEQSETFLNDWNAKKGEAGWAGIYQGGNPFTNHMIRERVSVQGELRELEPAEDLQGLNMPLDEVGFIKEGPAMRYLNGQSIWNKKYHRASKGVQKRREKNLKIAHKESEKRTKEWLATKSKLQQQSKSHTSTSKEEAQIKESVGSEKAEDIGAQGRLGENEAEEDEEEKNQSWSWALNGEAPPPSAVVSRRDITEARQLALMADRLDSAHGTSFHGLSIWVGLATFFSNSNERNKASEAVKAARELKKSQKKDKLSENSGGNGNDERDIWSDLDDNHQDENDDDTEEQVVNRHGDLSTTSYKSKKGKPVEGKKDRKKKGLNGWFGFLKKKSE
ncbi:uncharacterized protein IL334_003621 [Kwoniella shivajii]|uniref:Alpha/beta hydrolase fold-3 domain-containing protein n=1 Tax=Kwoniella shivajii TaxID=564305 RepID=A0ABZ1CYF2_9TREE|nr:hypothetical protein IL334_003621 [Kwoniella shivajii]